MLEAQNRRIDDLMERIRLQQEKLDKQNVRIRTLQSQVSERCDARTHVPAPRSGCGDVFYRLVVFFSEISSPTCNFFSDPAVTAETLAAGGQRRRLRAERRPGATRLSRG